MSYNIVKLNDYSINNYRIKSNSLRDSLNSYFGYDIFININSKENKKLNEKHNNKGHKILSILKKNIYRVFSKIAVDKSLKNRFFKKYLKYKNKLKDLEC